jgi:heme/copper-type cytochrome/quinol oxidase subunit 4
MEEKNEQLTVVQHGIRMGLILGVASIILTLLFYLIDPTLFAKWWLNLIVLFVIIVVVVILGRNYRLSIGGFMSFGDAFKHGFIIFLLSGLLSGFFNILLFQVIDQDLKTVVGDAAIEQTEAMMEKFGAPDEQIEEALEKAEESMAESFSTSGQLKGQMWAILFYVILSLITGLIVRKQEDLSDVV